ncbi:MAG: hypothetical protein GYB68_20210 [Chloroflexi bacterium]|nr:hypothetical protein [Chloroflexota bacterium]
MTIPAPALIGLYWTHLLATIVWIGGLATLVLIVWPGLLRLDEGPVSTLLERIEQRFRPLANLSLAVLLVTGMLQMTANANYAGLLLVTNDWSIAMLLKHIVFGGMVIVTLVIQLGVLPNLARARLQIKANPEAGQAEEQRQRSRLRQLTTLNLALGVLVLFFTAALTVL